MLSVDTFGLHLCLLSLMCVSLCDSSGAVPGIRSLLCVFVQRRVCLCVRALVWSAAMLLGSRWHHGWQGRGCLAQLIRQLRIGQLGGPSASRVCVCVCVCTTECHDVDSGGPVGLVTRPCRVLLSSLSECPLCHPAFSPLSRTLAVSLAQSAETCLVFYLSFSFFDPSFPFVFLSHCLTLRSIFPSSVF